MRPVLYKVGSVSNTLIIGLERNDDEGLCLSEFLNQIFNEACTIAELWHELGDNPGALDPILDYAFDEYLAFERYELKKIIRVYIDNAETNSRTDKKWCIETRQIPSSYASRESTKEAT